MSILDELETFEKHTIKESVLDKLEEYFVHGDKVYKLSTANKPVYVEIFGNPNPREIIQLRDEYRAIRGAIWKGVLYVWRGNILHDNALDIMKQKDPSVEWEYRFIYDPKNNEEIDAYGEDIVGDLDAKKLIKKIFPTVQRITNADSGEVIASI